MCSIDASIISSILGGGSFCFPCSFCQVPNTEFSSGGCSWRFGSAAGLAKNAQRCSPVITGVTHETVASDIRRYSAYIRESWNRCDRIYLRNWSLKLDGRALQLNLSCASSCLFQSPA